MSAKTFLFFHIVITTKYRRRRLVGGWPLNFVRFAAIFLTQEGRPHEGAEVLAVESGADGTHAHILVCLPPHIAVADFVRDLKSMSGRILNNHYGTTGRPFWSVRYFARTVGEGDLDAAQRYVENQWEKERRTIPFNF